MPSSTDRAPTKSILLLVLHGMLAFFLNVANFNAVKQGGPLMMNVVGNVKAGHHGHPLRLLLQEQDEAHRHYRKRHLHRWIDVVFLWLEFTAFFIVENQRERMSKAEKVSDGESETLLKKDRV